MTRSPQSPTDDERRAWLVESAERRGVGFVEMVCRAIDKGDELPSEALQALSSALRELLADGAPQQRLRQFGKAMKLSGQRGRPAEAMSPLAVDFWINVALGMTHAESLEATCAEFHKDARTVERAVRKHVYAKDFANQIVRGVRSQKLASPDK